MDQQTLDLWKIVVSALFTATGWFLITLYNKVEKMKDADKTLAVLESRVTNMEVGMTDHKSEVRQLGERFSNVERGMTQLQTYHERDAENWSFVFEKLDALAAEMSNRK